jgi:hypothetical protein
MIIVFVGKAQSGKSTSAKIVKEILESKKSAFIGNVYILSFATKLKEIAIDLFDWDGKDKGIYYKKVNDRPVMEYDQSSGTHDEAIRDKGRQLLINIGQQMRWIRPTVWVDYLKKRALQILQDEEYSIVIVDDCRFKNEVSAMREIPDCCVIKIQGRGNCDINDISEKDLDDYTGYDYLLNNDKSMDDLRGSLEQIIDEVLNAKQ